MKTRWGWFLLVPLALSLALTLGTQSMFLEKSFFKELGLGQTGAFVGIANFIEVLQNRLYLSSIATTLRVAALATIVCLLFAYPVAYTIARSSGRWAMVMLSGILLTSLVSAPIKVLGLIIIFAKESALNRFLIWCGVFDKPISLLGNEAGVVVGLLYYSLAFAVLLLYSVIRTIPTALEDAAAIHGATRSRTFWRVVLPLSLPGIVAVALTVFSLSMGAFAAAALMGGGRVRTLPVLIYQLIFTETKYATASTMSTVLLVLVLLINLVSAGVFVFFTARQRKRSARTTWHPLEALADLIGSARSAVTRRLGYVLGFAGRIIGKAWVVAAYVVLFAPLFVVVCASFNGGSFRSGAIVFPPRHFSFDWYLQTPATHVHAFAVSVALALAATALACAIGLPASLGLARSRARGREAAAALFRIPLQIPVVIIGLAFFYTYYAFDDATGLSITGSFIGLVIAHCFILTPFVIASTRAVLERFDPRLEEAAASLGARSWSTFRRVTLPVIAPGIFAGAIYAFMVSFGDVPISLFLAGPDTVTFPVEIFHSMEIDFDARILSSSTLVMLFGMILLLMVQKVIGIDRFARSQAGAVG